MKVVISVRPHYASGLFKSPSLRVSSLCKARILADGFCMGVSSVIESNRFTVRILECFFNRGTREYDFREIESFDFVV